MILKHTFPASTSGLLLTSIFLAALPPLSGPFSKVCDLQSRRYDSQLQPAVDRALGGPAGGSAVMDVESGGIQDRKNLGFAGKRLIWPGTTLKRCVLMELLESRKLGAKQRLFCRRALRIGGMWLGSSHTADVSQLDADDAMVVYMPRGRGGDAAIVADSVFKEHRQIKKKP